MTTVYSKTKRNINIDIAKAIAILSVIAIHVSGPLFYEYEFLSFNGICNFFISTLVRFAVPIFFMCSGALMLSPEKDFSIKKLFSKNILRIIAAMFFWAIAYEIYTLITRGDYSAASVLQSVRNILLFNHSYHFYYMHIILIVYLLLPVTRLIVKNAEKRELEYIIIIWVFFALIYPIATKIWPFSLLGSVTKQWGINLTYSSVGYGILGYYLKKYPLKLRADIVLIVLGFLITFSGAYILSLRSGYINEVLLTGTSPCVAALACGVFSMCMKLKDCKSPFMQTAVTETSRASFCIYLVHVMFISILENIGITPALFPPLISIPAFTVVIYILSYFTYLIISKIPLARKWII